MLERNFGTKILRSLIATGISPNRARSDRSSILKRAMRFLKRFYNAIKKHVDSPARLDATPYSASRWPPRIDAALFQRARLLFMDNNRYGEWVRRYDSLTAEDSKKIRARIASLAYKPLISVIMPVYNTPSVFLREAIDSVRTQLYDK